MGKVPWKSYANKILKSNNRDVCRIWELLGRRASWNSSFSQAQSGPCLIHFYPFIHLGGRRHWESTKTRVNPGSNTLTMRPPHLHISLLCSHYWVILQCFSPTDGGEALRDDLNNSCKGDYLHTGLTHWLLYHLLPPLTSLGLCSSSDIITFDQLFLKISISAHAEAKMS